MLFHLETIATVRLQDYRTQLAVTNRLHRLSSESWAASDVAGRAQPPQDTARFQTVALSVLARASSMRRSIPRPRPAA